MNALIPIVVGVALASGGAQTDPPRPADPLGEIRFLVGRWSGSSEGQAGKGSVTRVYEPILNGRFVHERNRSEYPAQPANPKGEVHEHWSFLGYDKVRKAVVFRQFHVEGFVVTYRLLPGGGADKRLVFESDEIENLAAGWKARETYERLSEDEFTETFELGAPGKPFEVFGKAHLKRTR
jgi:hypothetical protein